ncbi:FkbM family methyltransferase [Telluribacter humicola]|uniref:FkbM family methyltransferase n=1 Tax=Telluribacter humicola TaxID=1720261 RepID=UPI001A972AD3|nr:FkbM family methyltransferase [Telluribacter humicola]
MKSILKNIINRVGYDINRYPSINLKRRLFLLQDNKINTIIDVGANIGQYATECYRIGFEGRIVSFEPLEDAYQKLEEKASKIKNWETIKSALGDKDEDAFINVSQLQVSSSILQMNNTYITNSYSNANYIKKEQIKVKKLDTIFSDYFDPENENILLKIDAQGYEDKIIEGAKKSMNSIKGIQIEMSLVELYQGETLIVPMINKLHRLGYELKSFEPGFYNPTTTELYQIDGLFFRGK